MKTINSKNGLVKIFTDNVEEQAVKQIEEMANSVLGVNAHIRIMPDCHKGNGCTIGTTMVITDKVCPNLVGVDIGCGVQLVKTNIDFSSRLGELDDVIRKYIPYGMSVHNKSQHVCSFDFSRLSCWSFISDRVKSTARRAMGTLGGGNHFIEAYSDGYLSVHSGSRNIGYNIANHYQELAISNINTKNRNDRKNLIKSLPPEDRQVFIDSTHVDEVSDDLCWLDGVDALNYLHDVKIMQEFAKQNRAVMLDTILEKMYGVDLNRIESIHNYIDVNEQNPDYSGSILRKGAIDASKGKLLVIPLNMRDGMLICVGKGNEDWNFSAPHGAGRLYSRTKAKALFTLEQYKLAMSGIYSTCVDINTLDEAPFAYKDFHEIVDYVEPTVKILERIVPIYNFKSTDDTGDRRRK